MKWSSIFVVGALSLAGCEDSASTSGPRLAISRTRVDFGAVAVGVRRSEYLQVTNQGDAPLVLSAPAVDADDTPSPFSAQVDDLELAPGAHTSLAVRFQATRAGTYAGTLRFETNDPDALAPTVSLVGVGASSQSFEVHPDLVDFGNVVAGTQVAREITLLNPSESPVALEIGFLQNVVDCVNATTEPLCARWSALGPDAEGRVTLAAGATVVLTVEMRAETPGVRERGTLAFSVCAHPDCTVEVRLAGTTVDTGLLCETPVSFERVRPGGCTSSKVSCENRVATPIVVTQWAVADDPAGVFEASPSRVVALEPGERLEVDVEFCPNGLGAHRASLAIQTTVEARRSTVQVVLEGTGGGPQAEFSPAEIDFGPVRIGDTVRRALLITNVGFEDLEVTAIELLLGEVFTVLDTSPSVIPPGAARVVFVEFSPAATGEAQDVLHVSTNDASQPVISFPIRGTGEALAACEYALAPAAVDFGAVRTGAQLERLVVLRNEGPEDCLVYDFAITPGSDRSLSLRAPATETQRIAPGASLRAQVRFAPERSGHHEGEIALSPSRPGTSLRIPLGGEGTQDGLQIFPWALDFGPNRVGCTSPARDVEIFNPTAASVTIDAIEVVEGTAFDVSSRPGALPTSGLTLAPGASARFSATYVAGAGPELGAIEVRSTLAGLAHAQRVPLVGAGDPGAVQEESFDVPTTAKVDVLLVLDLTDGRAPQRAALTTNLQEFLRYMEAEGVDFQVGITTTDVDTEAGALLSDGVLSHRVLTAATTPSAAEVLEQIIVARTARNDGPADKAGLHAAYLALDASSSGRANPLLLRPDAALAVIFVSDEDDQASLSRGAPSDEPRFYAAFLEAFRGHVDEVTASAVVGEPQGGCFGPGGSAAPAPRYVVTAERTGGVYESICNLNWHLGLRTLVETSFYRRLNFTLQGRPDPSSIEVLLDGVPVPATSSTGARVWTYSTGTHAVSFSVTAAPDLGARVTVRYAAACE